MEYQRWRFSSAAGVLVAAAAALQLMGCSHAEDPAQVCAAAETQNQAKLLLGRAADEAAAKLTSALPLPKVEFADAKQLAALKLDLVTLASADKTTGKITCSGQVSLNIPADLRGKLTTAMSTADASLSGAEGLLSGGQAQLTFSRQLQADGKGFVYSLDGASSVDVIDVAWVLLTAAENAQTAAAQLQATAALAASPAAPDGLQAESSQSVAPASSAAAQ